jgi:hypothetical protein
MLNQMQDNNFHVKISTIQLNSGNQNAADNLNQEKIWPQSENDKV